MPFRNPFRSKPRFHIEPEEKKFLIECFCYFGGRYGPIVPGAAPVTFDAAHFPQTFAAPNVQPGTVLADLRTILGMPTSLNISFDWLPDFSDAQLPYQEFGERTLSATHPSDKGSYRIDLRQVLQKTARSTGTSANFRNQLYSTTHRRRARRYANRRCGTRLFYSSSRLFRLRSATISSFSKRRAYRKWRVGTRVGARRRY